MSRTSDPVQPSRPRPVLLLALAVGAVLVYALQGLVPLLMDGEVPRPDELLAPPSPVVLGGPIGAYEEASYPFIRDELRLLERRLQADRPTLGICLGAQMMARALGARVYPGPRKEIGWTPLCLSPEGQVSPLAHVDGALTSMLHWHGDTFDLPHGATGLASTDLYPNQAFSWGRSALALQCHPEVRADRLEHWLIGHAAELAAAGISIPDLRAENARLAPTLEQQGQRFFDAWLTTIETSP